MKDIIEFDDLEVLPDGDCVVFYINDFPASLTVADVEDLVKFLQEWVDEQED